MRIIVSFLVGWVLLGLLAFASWVTHIWWSLSGLFSGEMDTLSKVVVALLGLFVPPLGCIHGVYLWFT